jgi:hypothetical protein
VNIDNLKKRIEAAESPVQLEDIALRCWIVKATEAEGAALRHQWVQKWDALCKSRGELFAGAMAGKRQSAA